MQVDFKELFTYKFLELMGLGSKIYFLVNPYLKDGLFIMSENDIKEIKYAGIGEANKFCAGPGDGGIAFRTDGKVCKRQAKSHIGAYHQGS